MTGLRSSIVKNLPDVLAARSLHGLIHENFYRRKVLRRGKREDFSF
jgi:hypothetical protein